MAAGRRVLLAERRKGTTELEAEVRAIQATLAAMRLSRRGRLLALARAARHFLRAPHARISEKPAPR